MLAVTVTDTDVETLRAVCDDIQVSMRTLGARTRPRATRVPFDRPGRARIDGEPWTMSAFNPTAPAFDVVFGEHDARARLVANALYEGPPDNVHGGVGAHLMDCMLGVLLQAQGRRSVTATLDLRYLRRTPLDEPLDLYSRIVETRGRKTVAEGWIEHAGTRTVEARGLFVEVPAPTRTP
ncbi:PaaI family thioesterase [Rhodococcus sp. HNM0569]|nr:PaaI family thioesterase [Rhodococcus sp. HNM0569]